MLTAIKLLHTIIWAFLAASILALPVVGMLRRFRWAAILTVIVLLECGVLAVNGGRCPLSDLAARFTVDGNSNFDTGKFSGTSLPPAPAIVPPTLSNGGTLYAIDPQSEVAHRYQAACVPASETNATSFFISHVR